MSANVKADVTAAERGLRAACGRAVDMIRDGADLSDVVELLTAAGQTAELLLEP